MGHIQATGIDDRGRKQYVYHRSGANGATRRSSTRWSSFARCLPKLRRRVKRDLRRHELDRARARLRRELLDRGFFRIGARTRRVDDSYGLATMRKEHVTLVRARPPPLRVPGEERQGAGAVDRRSRGLRHRPDAQAAPWRRRRLLAYKAAGAGSTSAPRTSTDTSRRPPRGFLSEGLPHVERDGARGDGARGVRTGREGVEDRGNRAVTRAVKEVATTSETRRPCAAPPHRPRVFDRSDAGLTISGALHELGEEPDLASIHGAVEKAVLDWSPRTRGRPHRAVEEIEALAA